MDEIISKELLSAILGTEFEVTRYELDENEILFYLIPQNGIEFGRTINVYELMAIAIKWIHSNMYCDIIMIDASGSRRESVIFAGWNTWS